MILHRKRRPPRSVRRKRRARDREQQHLFRQALVAAERSPQYKELFLRLGDGQLGLEVGRKGVPPPPRDRVPGSYTGAVEVERGYPWVRAVSLLPPPPCAVVLNSRAYLLWGTEWDGMWCPLAVYRIVRQTLSLSSFSPTVARLVVSNTRVL